MNSDVNLKFMKSCTIIHFKRDKFLEFVDEVIDTDEEKDNADQPDLDLGPSVQRIRTEEEFEGLVDDTVFLVYLKPLLTLAKINVNDDCLVQGCNSPVVIETDKISSALYLKWLRSFVACKYQYLLFLSQI